jgi:hypothetical protein
MPVGPGVAAVHRWIEEQLFGPRYRFAQLRRAELHASAGLSANWHSFRWYEPASGFGRPVAELTFGVAASTEEDVGAASALARFLGGEPLPSGSAEEARTAARRAGLDFVFWFNRAAGPSTPSSATGSNASKPSVPTYHLELRECESGSALWTSTAEQEEAARLRSASARYQQAALLRREAIALWRELCIEAGIVPDGWGSGGDVAMSGMGLSAAVSPSELEALASAVGASAPAYQRDLMTGYAIRLLFDPAALARHTAQLINHFRAGAGKRFPSHALLPDAVAEALATGGPTAFGALDDAQLAALLLNPVALYDLAERIDDVPPAWVAAWRALRPPR